MAVTRDRPYCRFNFLVDLGTGDTASVDAGFEEVILPEVWVDVIEYRTGNQKENSVRKITGLEHCGNVTLKRGVIGSLNLYQWYNDVRNGGTNSLRTVRIQLQNEDRSEIVQTWTLMRARVVKITSPTLNAKGTDVAIESVELACERLELE
jgi:phage tail-like protein